MKPNEIGLMLGVGEDPARNIAKAKSLGLHLVQLGSPKDEWLAEPKRSQLRRMIDDAGIEVFSVFVAFPGESYADIPTVRRTVGFLDPSTREARLARSSRIIDLAKLLGATYASLHVGFIPLDPALPAYGEMVRAVQRMCDAAGRLGLRVALETGQEPADVLVEFVRAADRDNLCVNFDPANMILYGSGDPHDALAKLKQWVVSVHCKDAVGPTEKGRLGTERPLGEGAVDIPRFIGELKAFGFKGPLVIEREISGAEQLKDVKAAIALLERLRK